MNELDKRFSDTNNEIILTSNIFHSSSPDYFDFKSPFFDEFLQNYKHFNIDKIKLKAAFLSSKELLSGVSDANHDIFPIQKYYCNCPKVTLKH